MGSFQYILLASVFDIVCEFRFDSLKAMEMGTRASFIFRGKTISYTVQLATYVSKVSTIDHLCVESRTLLTRAISGLSSVNGGPALRISRSWIDQCGKKGGSAFDIRAQEMELSKILAV